MQGKKITNNKFGKTNFKKNMSQVTKFNKLLINVPLLYPLKTSENRRSSNVFREYRIGILVKKRFNNTGKANKTSNNKNKKKVLRRNK